MNDVIYISKKQITSFVKRYKKIIIGFQEKKFTNNEEIFNTNGDSFTFLSDNGNNCINVLSNNGQHHILNRTTCFPKMDKSNQLVHILKFAMSIKNSNEFDDMNEKLEYFISSFRDIFHKEIMKIVWNNI